MDWKKCKLSDLMIFKNGKKRPKSIGTIPVYGGNGILEFTNDFNNQNCIIIGRVGAYCGSVYREPSKCWVSDNAISCVANDTSDIVFDYYLLKHLQLNKRHIGTSQPLITQDILNNIEIKLPPLEEQKRIAAILSALDDKIEINRKINENLEQQAQALFKSWFIDFEPFSADGTMPSEWRIGSVGEIIELHDSKRIPLSGAQRAKMDKIYPYYGATSLMDYVDDYIFDGIYLLLGEDGTVVDDRGFPILQYINGKFWVNNHAHILTGKLGFSVEELYLFFSLTNIKSIVTGAVQQKVSQGNLKSIPATIPPESVLRDFDNLIQPLFSEIRNLRDECANLASLRDTLLPKLMSGELDVSDIDI